jgi:hypothetical protein
MKFLQTIVHNTVTMRYRGLTMLGNVSLRWLMISIAQAHATAHLRAGNDSFSQGQNASLSG